LRKLSNARHEINMRKALPAEFNIWTPGGMLLAQSKSNCAQITPFTPMHSSHLRQSAKSADDVSAARPF
jgi:hypothetical protein